MLIELVVGAVLALPVVAFVRRLGSRNEGRLYAVSLFIAAAIYVGFAFVGAADRRWMILELAGLVLFIAFAWLGLRSSPWWFVAGWAAHATWDMGLHLVAGTPEFVPVWYPGVCIGFDLLVAGAIGLRAWGLGGALALEYLEGRR
jgi:hypothetical protein